MLPRCIFPWLASLRPHSCSVPPPPGSFHIVGVETLLLSLLNTVVFVRSHIITPGFWLGGRDSGLAMGQNLAVHAHLRLLEPSTHSPIKTVQCLIFYHLVWGLQPQISKIKKEILACMNPTLISPATLLGTHTQCSIEIWWLWRSYSDVIKFQNHCEVIWALWHGALSAGSSHQEMVHCGHEGMDMVSSNTQDACSI